MNTEEAAKGGGALIIGAAKTGKTTFLQRMLTDKVSRPIYSNEGITDEILNIIETRQETPIIILIDEAHKISEGSLVARSCSDMAELMAKATRNQVFLFLAYEYFCQVPAGVLEQCSMRLVFRSDSIESAIYCADILGNDIHPQQVLEIPPLEFIALTNNQIRLFSLKKKGASK